jgi:hypothetical protein
VDCLVTHLQVALDELKDTEEHLELRKLGTVELHRSALMVHHRLLYMM